jgi:hypothetical protein
MTPRLARNVEEVVENIRNFAPALADSVGLQDRLSYARSWYILQDGKKGPVFAPSKWAGYRNMSPSAYLDNATAMDGRKTEARLRKWSAPIDPQSEQYEALYDKLVALLARYGKQPSAEARIAIIEDAEESLDDDDSLAELIIRVGKRLKSPQRVRISDALRF